MNKRLQTLWIMAAVSILIIVFVPYLLMKLSWLDFTGKNNADLATSVNGFTAPVIGIVTSVFLFMNLLWQGENLELQRSQNEFQTISSLVDDIGESIEKFDITLQKWDDSVPRQVIYTTHRGMDGIRAMAQNLDSISPQAMPLSVTRFPGCTRFISIIVKIEQVKSLINESRLTSKVKSLFLDNVNTYILSLYEPGTKMEAFCRTLKLPDDIAYQKLKVFAHDYQYLRYTVDGEKVPVDQITRP